MIHASEGLPMPPVVSVFITSYNQRDYLREAVDSVLGQSRRPDQVVIVDDGSSDGSQGVIQAYAGANPGVIDYALHEQNLGVAATKNHAASLCTGDLMTYLDGDDRMLPGRLEGELAVLDGAARETVVFSDFRTIDPEGLVLTRWAEGVAVPEGEVLGALLARAYPKGTVYRNELMPRSLFERVGGYDPRLNLYEDWDLRIRMAAAGGTTVFRPALGSEYRLHPGGVSRQDPARHLSAVTYIRRKHAGLIASLEAGERMSAGVCFDRLERVFAGRAAQRSLRRLRFRDAMSFGLRAWGGGRAA